MYGHGKLDLKFVHGRAENRGWKKQDLSINCVHIVEIVEENKRTTRFGEKGLFICGYIYFGKQLLPQINVCCREVMQNNKVTPIYGPNIV